MPGDPGLTALEKPPVDGRRCFEMDMATLAGSFSTAIFVGSCFPMLVKAIRTRDLDSYSRGQLALANFGNLVNSLYVFSLPVGPIWILHLFNVTCTLFMFVWHLRFAGRWGGARGVTALEDRVDVLV